MDKSNDVFGTFEPEVLPDKVANHILQLILDGVLKPGQKLPPERELAETMNVGRTSLRGALRALAMMNVIEVRHGSGAFVSSLHPNRLVEHLEFIFRLDESTIYQLFYARRIIEVGIVKLAAEHITDEQLARLQACVERCHRAPNNMDVFHHSDVEFHKIIADAANNPFLSRCRDAVWHLSMTQRDELLEAVHKTGALATAINQHERIIDALTNRDPVAAEKVMLEHLDTAEANLRYAMNEL